MELIGFMQSAADPCVYIRTADTVTVVAVYVDDLIVIGKTAEEMQHVKESLTAQFKMKDMGKLHYYSNGGVSTCMMCDKQFTSVQGFSAHVVKCKPNSPHHTMPRNQH